MASSQSCSNHHVLTTCCEKSQECNTFTDLPSIKVRESELCNIAKQNRSKNRFIDVLPFDNNRVILNDGSYINASFIQRSNPILIATQSPMVSENDNTIGDFWTMAWEQNASVIINLSPKQDDAKYMQLEQPYYVCNPTTIKINKKHIQAQCFGKMIVYIDYKYKAIGISSDSSYTSEAIVLTQVIIEKEGIQKPITHIQVNTWMDMSPLDITTFAALIKIVNNLMKNKEDQSIICHCTAGIGRTGTFLGAYIKLFSANYTSTFELVKHMRECRPNMVQKPEQFQMIETIQKTDLCVNIIIPKNWTNKTRMEKQFNSTKMRFEYRISYSRQTRDQNQLIDNKDKPKSVTNAVNHHFVITHFGEWPKDKDDVKDLISIKSVDDLWASKMTDMIILCKPEENDLSMYWPTPELELKHDIQYCGEELFDGPSIIVQKRKEILQVHLFKKSGKTVKLIRYLPKKTKKSPTKDPFLSDCYQMKSLRKYVEIQALEMKLEKTIKYLHWN